MHDLVTFAENDNESRVVIENNRGIVAAMEPDDAEALARDLVDAARNARQLRGEVPA